MSHRVSKLSWATEKEALVFLPSDFLARSQCYLGLLCYPSPKVHNKPKDEIHVHWNYVFV